MSPLEGVCAQVTKNNIPTWRENIQIKKKKCLICSLHSNYVPAAATHLQEDAFLSISLLLGPASCCVLDTIVVAKCSAL